MRAWSGLIALFCAACLQHSSVNPEPAPTPAAVFFAQESLLRLNPELNPQVEVILRSTAGVSEAKVTMEGLSEVFVGRDEGGGRFVVSLEVVSLPDGDYTLEATGAGSGLVVASSQRMLRIGRQGVRHTDFESVNTALSPMLHHVQGQLAISWTDRRQQQRRVYWQALNSALEPVGEPIALTDQALTVARAEVLYDGRDHLGILMQTLDAQDQRHNQIMVVDLEGRTVLAPERIEQGDETARAGGGIAYDGDAFVAVTRSDSPAKEQLRFVRFSGAGVLTPPTRIAGAGDGTPVGGFLPHMTLSIAAHQMHSVIGFKRQLYDQRLEMYIQRNHVTIVDRSGAVLVTEMLTSGLSFSYDQEVVVQGVGDDIVALWTTTDLESAEPNPPYRLHGNRAVIDAPPSRWRPLILTDEPLDRTEFELTEDPNGYAYMLWQDLRLRAGDEAELLRLMVAPLSSDFRLAEPKVLKHPRVFLGNSSPSMVYHQGQFVLAWVDVRNSQGASTKSEIFLEAFSP